MGPFRGRAARSPGGADDQAELTLTYREARGGVTRTVRRTGRQPCLVRIPPGIADGRRIRLRGQGLARPDGSHGDLLITVTVSGPARHG
jgi:molecular chaperone DnaJ